MSTPISSTAESAREQHRSPDGKFGNQPAAEAQSTTLSTNLDHIIEAQGTEANAAAHLHEEASKRLTKASLIGAAGTIRKAYPEAQTMLLEDNYEGGVHWKAKDANGDSIDDIEDGELDDELWDAAAGVDMTRAGFLAPYAKGHDPSDDSGYLHSGAIDVDKYTGTVTSLEVDIDEMLTRANDAPAQ